MSLSGMVTVRLRPAGADSGGAVYDVGFAPRPRGGCLVVVSGRVVGWLVHELRESDRTQSWVARVSAAAFRGTGPTDRGSPQDAVPLSLVHAKRDASNRVHHLPVAHSASRQQATRELLAYLEKHRAPAIGYPRHEEVEPCLVPSQKYRGQP